MGNHVITSEEIPSRSPANDNLILSQAEEIAAEIGQRFDAARQGKREPWDHSAWNWASEIGHPCKKFLVHARVDWKDRQLMDIDGEYRVEEGSRAEWQLKKDLGDIGFQLNESQRTFTVPDLKIKGKVDGLLPLNREIRSLPKLIAVPIEIKTVNPNYWETTKTIEDIKRHRAWWIRGYPSQLNVYLYAPNSPFGFFILKTFGKRPRILPMLLDYDRLDGDFRKIEDVNRHVEAGTYPEPIPYDPQICGMCDFSHLCQPLKATKMEEVSQGDVPLLEFYLELKEQKEKFDDLHKKLVGTKDKPGRYHGKDAIINDIVISTTKQFRKFYSIPDEVKAPYEESKEIIITTIERV